MSKLQTDKIIFCIKEAKCSKYVCDSVSAKARAELTELLTEIERLRGECEKNKYDRIALCCEIAAQQDEIKRLTEQCKAQERGVKLE